MKSEIYSIPWYLERAIPGAGDHSSSHSDCGYLYMNCCGTFLFSFLVLCLEFEAGNSDSDLGSIEQVLVNGYEEMLRSIFLDSVSVPIHHAGSSYSDYECDIPDELLSTAIDKLENVLELKVLVSQYHHQQFIKGLIQTVLLNMGDSEVATQVCERIDPLFSHSQHSWDYESVIAWFEEDFIVGNFELIDSSSGKLALWFKTFFERDMEWSKP